MAASLSPDAALSRRLQARDRHAWEELYATHGPRLRAFALRLTGNPHDADDLVQETFVRALPRLDALDAENLNLRAYLFTALRNTFLKGWERGRRVAVVDEVPEPDVPGAIEDDPERSALLRRQIEEVRAANEELAPRQRLALALRELEGCSYAEIGQIVGLNENAVAQLISRARDSLRSALRLGQVDAAALPGDCRRMLPQLSRHLDGQLRGDPLERMLAHLGDCPHCRAALESMREASRRYRSLVPPLLLAEDALAASIDARLTAAGYWAPRRSRLPLRVPRRALVAAGLVLLLGGGGLLAVASGGDRAKRAAVRSQATTVGLTTTTTATATASLPGAARPTAPAPRTRSARRGAQRRPSGARPHASAGTGRTPERVVAPGVRSDDRPATVPQAARRRAPTRRADQQARPRAQQPAAGTQPDRPPPASGGEAPRRTTPAPAPGPPSDTTAPIVTITSASTSDDRATFAFTASERVESFACSLDGGGFEPCSSPKNYSGLAAGSHTFAVRATDAAGNTGTPATRAWRVAERLPDLVITALTETSVTVANVGDGPSGSFVVSVTPIGSFSFAGLTPGASMTRTWRCRSARLEASADSGNSVAESNEGNNRSSLSASC